jgi:hypothetical protein
MYMEAILRALERYTGYFPRGPLKAAVARQEEITPHLLAMVEEGARDIDRLVEDETYMGPIYAFYLLAQFREERAYPLIVEFFSIPGEVTMEVTGDFVTESLQQVLASVSGGDMGPMVALARQASANEYVRAAALHAPLCLVAEGIREREAVVATFRDLFHGGLDREPSYAWDALVSACTDLYPGELMGEIRQTFADDLLADDWSIDLDWVERSLDRGKAMALAELRENTHYQFIDDVIAETAWWASFDSVPEDLGRNDRCLCGSGMKYKRCCGDPRLS